MNTEQMINDIIAELARARKKFPGNAHQYAAFAEEAGELGQALLQNHYEGKADRDVYWEAVQAAAMAIRVGVEGDSTFDYNPPQNLTPPGNKTMNSTDDNRTENNVMRHQYRVLTDIEKMTMQDVKDQGLALHDTLSQIGNSRELSLAKTKIEEAVMWAVKHITA